MTRFAVAFACLLALAASLTARAEDRAAPAAEDKPLIQIAILLDTSGSMDGLIDQARTHLWKIVNELATSRRDGRIPRLEVALYEYGKSSLSQESGWIRQIVPLSTDLDRISEELFKLTTNGGQEYCGRVIHAATTQLAWSASPRDYRAIFIAGNEPFTQGDYNYADACRAAIARGIIVNTIHCGDHATGVQGKWLDGAQLADGSYSAIDQNQRTVHIDAPQDVELVELNGRLNRTYVAFGSAAPAAAARQEAQDAAASKLSLGVFCERVAAKASGQYRNAQWDLVDAAAQESFDLTTVSDEQLPEELRGKTAPEKQAYVAAKAAERAELQAKIRELSAAREAYIAEERRKLAEGGQASLDEAVVGAVREQLEKKDYTFEKR